MVTARSTTATACCPHFNSRQSRARAVGYSVSTAAELRADPAALQQRRVEGPKAFAENVSRNGTELGESAMKRFIDFEQIAA